MEKFDHKDIVIPMPPKPPKFGSLQVKADSKTPYSDATLCKKGARVKRPMNAFMVWSREERRKIVEVDPDMDNALISMMLGKRWKTLSNMQRQPYIEEAERLKQLHLLENPGYRYIPRKKKNGPVSGGKKVKTASAAASVKSPDKYNQGRRKSSTGSLSSFDSNSSPTMKSDSYYRSSAADYMTRKVSNTSLESNTTCLSNSSSASSTSSGDNSFYLPPAVEPYDSTSCYLPSSEPYPEELDHYIVVEDPAEFLLKSSTGLSYKLSSSIPNYSSTIPNYTSNLTMPSYDWTPSSAANDYRDSAAGVCHSFSESESVYSSINSTVSEYEYLLPNSSLSDCSIPVIAQEVEISSSSPPASPQPANLDTMKTLDMIIDDMMNTPVSVGQEKFTQTDTAADGLPSISSIINGWQL